MSQEETLKQIARGAGIIFISTFIMYAIKFIYRIVIARYLGPADYGLLSLGIMLLNIGVLISVIGLNEGIVRNIAYYNGKKDKKRVKGTFLAAFKISMSLSILISITFLFFSDKISIYFFHNTKLIPILSIFSLIIPLYTLLIMATNAILAFKKPEYNIISRTFGRELTNLLLALVIVFFGGTVLDISMIYLISMAVGAILGISLLEYKVFPFIRSRFTAKYEYKNLLLFSVPLFFSGIFIEIMLWSDTFFLGLFKSSYEIGIYNVALPLAASLGIFLTAFSQIFYPIMSELHAKKKYDELNNNYSIVLKWIFMLSLPVVLIVLMFPERILSILFGEKYIAGSTALMILISAYFIDVITGPAVRILMTFKRTKLIFKINVIISILNVFLNILLIPTYGINGAAIATGISIVLRELIILSFARRIIKFKLKLKYYIKYIASAIISLSIIYSTTIFFEVNTNIKLILLVLVFLGLYVSGLILLKAFSKEDIEIMYAIENKFGLNLNFLKRIIKL
jgi:O-antigen/teichoic acid export membrane protein